MVMRMPSAEGDCVEAAVASAAAEPVGCERKRHVAEFSGKATCAGEEMPVAYDSSPTLVPSVRTMKFFSPAAAP